MNVRVFGLIGFAGRRISLARILSWMLRTRPAYAPAILAAADVGEQDLDLREYDVAVASTTAPRKG